MSNARDKANIPALNFSSTGIDDNATSTAITINSSERVGIGTSSPDGVLDVQDNTGSLSATKDITAEFIRSDGTYNPKLRIRHSTTGSDIQHSYGSTADNLTFSIGSSEYMRIHPDGKVGIGASSQAQKVAIVVDSSSTTITNGTQNLELSNINGTNGTYSRILFNDNPGGAGACCLGVKLTDTTNNYGQFEFWTKGSSGGNTRMVIDPNGNVGIGTSSPDSKVNIEATKTTALSTANDFLTLGLTVDDNTAHTSNVGGGIAFRGKRNTGGTQTVYGAIDGVKTGTAGDDYRGILRFFTNQNSTGVPLERMRIDSNGRVFIGTTSQIVGTHNHTLGVSQSGVETPITTETNSTIFRYAIDFHNPNGRVGYIATSASSTSFNTSSDYRLKENVSYDFDATTRLKQLKPARFNFIVDADKTVDGFLAHEVSSVVPEAITGTKDAVQVWKEGEELPEGVSVGDNKLDENGNTIPEYQGIDQAKLVPLLVKTIQELEARITTLENA